MAQRTQNTLVYSIRVLQGSVATGFGCDVIFDDRFIANFPDNLPVKNESPLRIDKFIHMSLVYYVFGTQYIRHEKNGKCLGKANGEDLCSTY